MSAESNHLNDTSQKDPEREALLNEIQDLKVLYEMIAEHSSAIENELEQKNQHITLLLEQLRKYLSPQLYNLILGQPDHVDLSYKRKYLTVFFSDIVGFTEISDRMDPEILSTLLNDYLNEMAQIAMEYGATIDKFIGDALMLFFGDPEYVDDEKHARDCCRMALDMQKKIQQLDLKWISKGIPQGLKVRMGIHSGYCTVGNFGSKNRMDYTIIGGNVNIASRLESLAEPKKIFISSVTRNLLSEEFDTRYNHSFHVKGIHYPIEIFELEGFRKKDSSDFNPYLNLDQNGFLLEKINYNPEFMSETEIQHVENALNSALFFIKKQKMEL